MRRANSRSPTSRHCSCGSRPWYRKRAFDTVLARAYAALPDLLASVAGLCGPGTRVLALKGRYPADELAELPPGWRLEHSRAVTDSGAGRAAAHSQAGAAGFV